MLNGLYERISDYVSELEQAVIDMKDDINEQDEMDNNITVREIESVIYDLKKILSEEKYKKIKLFSFLGLQNTLFLSL